MKSGNNPRVESFSWPLFAFYGRRRNANRNRTRANDNKTENNQPTAVTAFLVACRQRTDLSSKCIVYNVYLDIPTSEKLSLYTTVNVTPTVFPADRFTTNLIMVAGFIKETLYLSPSRPSTKTT